MIDPQLASSRRRLVVLHMANFWMPAERSDYGSEAIEVMGPEGVFVSLVEFGAEAAQSQLFEHKGIPVPLRPEEFSPARLQRPMGDQAGLQRFFRSGGRAFCLHVVIGAHRRRQVLAVEVNSIVSGLSIE